MLRPAWTPLLAVLGVLLLHSAGGVNSQCWESSKCSDLATETGILDCIKACKLDLTAESPMYPGNGHLQPLSENIRKYVMSHFRWNKFGRRNSSSSSVGHKREELPSHPLLGLFPGAAQDANEEEDEGAAQGRQENKRSYSMEHFRWGKPVGRKRRPIKVYPNGVEEESAESYPMEFRRDLSEELDYPALHAPDSAESEEMAVSDEEEMMKKDGGAYKMRHFRWNAPALDKRYGGFMTSEHSQTPLVTLFKNAIIKSAYKKGQ